MKYISLFFLTSIMVTQVYGAQPPRAVVDLVQAHRECDAWQSVNELVDNEKIKLNDSDTNTLQTMIEDCETVQDAYSQAMSALAHYSGMYNTIMAASGPKGPTHLQAAYFKAMNKKWGNRPPVLPPVPQPIRPNPNAAPSMRPGYYPTYQNQPLLSPNNAFFGGMM